MAKSKTPGRQTKTTGHTKGTVETFRDKKTKQPVDVVPRKGESVDTAKSRVHKKHD